MLYLRKMSWVAMLGAGLLAILPAVQAKAQEAGEKRVVVLSVASIDSLFKKIDFLAQTSGAPQMGQQAQGMAGGFIKGVDTTKPIGAVVTTKGDAFNTLAFIPVTDGAALLKTVEKNMGPSEDAGDGIKQLGTPVPLFAKEIGGWMYVAQNKDALSAPPADPATLLGGLDNEYAIALQANVQNIPPAYRDMAVEQLRGGIEASLAEPMPGESAEDFQTRKDLTKMQLEATKAALNELDQATLGWAVDETGASTYIDLSITAVEGTKTARQMASLAETTTDFAGFIQEDAAVSMHVASKIDKEEIEQTVTLMEKIRANAMKELEADEDLGDEERAAAKTILGTVLDVFVATIESGKMDMGATVMLGESKMTMVAGGYVADGKALEDGLKKLVELAKDDPDFPGVKWDAETHEGIRMHTMEAPLKDGDEDARNIFGDNVEVVVGVGEESFYLAFGKDTLSSLKGIIDASKAAEGKNVLPMQMSVSAGSIMRFAASMDDDPQVQMIAGLLEGAGGKDKINVTVEPMKLGAKYRIEVEEGILKAVGRMAEPPGGGGPGGPDGLGEGADAGPG